MHEARASLEDLAIRWETPRGRQIKEALILDLTGNAGERLEEILKDFIYVAETNNGRDLRCITFEDVDLTGAVFDKVDASWASFARSRLDQADFRNANIKRASFQNASLTVSRFAGADCSRADFTGANLEHANFKHTKMTGATLIGVNAVRASFEAANLSKCNLLEARLEQANLFNADCNSANFSSGAMETMAARPEKAWDASFDVPTDEFERQAGIKALTSRATRVFKGLDALLAASRLAAQNAKPKETTGKQPAQDGDMFFGAGLRSRPAEPPAPPPPAQAQAQDGDMFFGAGLPGRRRDEGSRPEPPRPEPPRNEPPWSEPQRSPPAARIDPPRRGTSRIAPPPTGGYARRPGTDIYGRPTPHRPSARHRPGTGAPPPAGTRSSHPGTRRVTKRASGSRVLPASQPAQAAPAQGGGHPAHDLAPPDPHAPPPSSDWASAIGQLMQAKRSVSRIVIETGGHTRIIYDRDA